MPGRPTAPPGAADGAMEALGRQLGGMLRILDPPRRVAGCNLTACVEPADGRALAAAVSALAANSLAALITGGCSRLEIGNQTSGVTVQLSTAALCGIEEFDAADGVIRVAAGTPLTDLQTVAKEAGWELGVDPPGPHSTVGGMLASAAEGPRRTAYGRPRQLVLGLDTVLGGGERTRCGGRVVKNVTGYDLAKLHVGGFGTLGVIEAAWLRLRPRPKQTLVWVASLPSDAAAHDLALEVARRPSTRVAALLSSEAVGHCGALSGLGGPSEWVLLCELAGDTSVCNEDARWLEERCGATASEASAIEQLRALQGRTPQGGLRACLHLVPSMIEHCCAILHEAGASLLVYPVPGVVYAWFADGGSGADAAAENPSDPTPALALALAAIERARAAADASCVLEAIPEALRSDRDVFGEAGTALPVMRALKARFDPAGLFNRARFVGGI
jgi:glycolate oxidase FAD binding subunit